MRLRLLVAVVLLGGLSLGAYLLMTNGSELAAETISQSRLTEMTGWSVGVEERLRNQLGFAPNRDGTLILYQTGVSGSEVRLYNSTTKEDKLLCRLELADPALVSDYQCSAFWLGTYGGVIITEYGGDVGPYRAFHYELAEGALRELPASLFIHPELNLNLEGLLGSPPGTDLLVVRSAVDDERDGLFLCTLSGERVAEVFSDRRGVFGLCGVSSQAILMAVHEGPTNEFGELGSLMYVYDLATRAVTPVPTDGVVMLPTFRPGTNTVTFMERDPKSQALYLMEYDPVGDQPPKRLLKLADGGGGYCWATYCWSVDGEKLYIAGP
jgi:hypothetical protein